MPNLKKAAKDKVSDYRRVITLTPGTAKRVDELAQADQRSVAAMLRILVERGIESIDVELTTSK